MSELQHTNEKFRALRPLLRQLPKEYIEHQGSLSALEALTRNIRAFQSGHVFKRFQERNADLVVVLSGMATKIRVTKNGKRRIVGFLLPGEISVSKSTP